MNAHASAPRLNDFAATWAGLAQCRDRGVHVYESDAGAPIYRSYAEIFDEAGPLAAALARRGIARGDRVLVCAATSSRFPVLWLALVWIGATPVPMPPRAALVGQYTFRERLNGIVPHFRFYICAADELTDIAETAAASGTSMHAFVLPALEHDTDAPAPARFCPQLDDVAFIQFTSGSTKAPKGILITYRNLFANAFEIASRLEYRPACDRLISWLPLYHDMGLVGKFLSALLYQMDLVLMSPQGFAKRPLQFLTLVGKHAAQICSMPNFALEWILRRLGATSSKQPPFSLASLRWLGVGAEPVQPETLQAFDRALRPYGLHAGVLSPCYGLAEATLAVAIDAPGTPYGLVPWAGRPYPTAGHILSGIDVAVSDDAMAPASVGRIRIRGDSVARQALINGEVRDLLDREGYYDTKDIGGIVDGRLFILGRADEMFIVNGENRFPYDIESAVRHVDGVLRNRVVCFHVAGDGIFPGRTVVLYESRPLPPLESTRLNDDIVAEVRRRTGVELTTVLAVAPKSIPVTPSGKIQRLRARQMFMEGCFRERSYRVAMGEPTTLAVAEPLESR